jgi:hypothetical protein
MNLATHNAIWNSKKGAAFAAVALTRGRPGGKDLLAPYLENMVPKLYRSSYDPSYNVSQAMVTAFTNTNFRLRLSLVQFISTLDFILFFRSFPEQFSITFYPRNFF